MILVLQCFPVLPKLVGARMASSSSTATIGTPTVPNGPAFVLVRFEKKGLSFRNTSPYKIRDVLKGMLACAAKEVSAIRSGALLIHTRDLSQTDALLKWRSFEGEEIRVMPADRLNQKEGLVYAPELMYESVETILSESEVQGVTKVTRLRSKTSRPNPLLKISFAAVDLPSHLYAEKKQKYSRSMCLLILRQGGLGWGTYECGLFVCLILLVSGD